jgi:Helix-turn-helix domain
MIAKRNAAIDAHVIDALMPDLVGHDRRPSAFIVYLYLAHAAQSRNSVAASLATIAGDTGLSKRAVQVAIGHLVRRRLLSAERAGTTAVPRYSVLRPWLRASTARSTA